MISSPRRVGAGLALLALAGPAWTPAASAQQRSAPAQAAQIAPAMYGQLRYRHIGPVGNRVAAVAGVPGDPDTYYAGAASGGIWKTTDAGLNWSPVFDDQPVHSIGSLAVAPSDPNVVWAGTGEPHIRSHISVGAGIFKSTDAGKSWTRMGLENTGRISRVIVHPTDPDVVYAASLGHAYGPQQERGVYRTTDGGKTWERVLFVDENTGVSDMVMDPSNPRVLYAGAWQIVIRTWGRESGGPGSGIFKSTDGGTTWTRLAGRGLPTRPVGKIGLGIARSDPGVVYALIETGDGVPMNGQPQDTGELWRSDDGGESWRVVSHDRNLACRQAYYTRMGVSPDDADEAYFLCASFMKTLDGGATTIDVPRSEAPGHDHHEMWIDPTDGDRMAVAHDGGVSISTNRGRSWLRVQLPIAQMYHVTVDNQVPYYVYGNKQDGPSYRGPSNSRLGSMGIPRGEWHGVLGGESGWATPDPVDPNIVWSSASGSGSVGGIVIRYDERSRQGQNVEVWPDRTGGSPAEELKYRFIWTFPLTISPHDRNRVYVGSQHVHVTTDGGRSWRVISPDLTTNDKSRQKISGGLTPDNIGVEYGSTLFAIAESPLQAGLIWTGSNDGQVHLTRDGGGTWTNVTRNIPGLLEWGTISNIEPSRYDAGTAYLTVDGHQVNNRDPWVYRTTDFGQTWKLIVNGVPKSPLSYAHVVKEDPKRRGMLYLGTENALYVSFDAGERWQPLQTNLPPSPVYWLTVQEHFNDLVVGTYGRGFWILDDITPLQQLTDQVSASEAHLFAPRPAYRFREISSPAAAYRSTDDPSVGENPPYGASISYWLKSAPSGDVAVSILDASGRTVRTLKGPKSPGINRIWWDLEGEPSKPARLRARHLYAPDVENGPEGWRPAPGFGRITLLMPPGTYTVKLSVGGREYTQPLVVHKDPHSQGTERDIAEQTQLLVALRQDLESVAEMINTIEMVRAQLESLDGVLSGEPAAAYTAAAPTVASAAAALNRSLVSLEEEMISLKLTGRGQDGVRWQAGLGSKISYLAGGISSADFAPTTQQREVAGLLREQVRALRTRFDAMMRQEVTTFNDLLRQQNLGGILVPLP